MKIQKKIIFLVLTVIMIFTVFSLQKKIDSLSADSLDIEFYYLPHGKTLKSFSLGYAPLIADIFWIKGILYFGKHISDEDDFPFLLKTLESKPAGLSTADREDIRKQKERYKYLYDFVNIVTDMDPYFRYPYIFGGMFLSMKYGEADKAIEILNKGLQIYPNDWVLYYYRGFNYLFYKADRNNALVDFVKAASLPGNTIYTRKMAEALVKDF